MRLSEVMTPKVRRSVTCFDIFQLIIINLYIHIYIYIFISDHWSFMIIHNHVWWFMIMYDHLWSLYHSMQLPLEIAWKKCFGTVLLYMTVHWRSIQQSHGSEMVLTLSNLLRPNAWRLVSQSPWARPLCPNCMRPKSYQMIPEIFMICT